MSKMVATTVAQKGMPMAPKTKVSSTMATR